MKNYLVKFAEEQFFNVNNDVECDLIGFYFEDADVTILNPFLDETGRFDVDPIEHYGKENFEKWKNEVIDAMWKTINE